MTTRQLNLAAISGILLCSGNAFAQAALDEKNFPAERFRPAIGATGILDTEVADVPAPFTLDAMLWLGYANDPLVLKRKLNGELEEWPLVAHRIGANLIGSMSFTGRLQLGFDLPIALYQTAANDVGSIASDANNVTAGGLGNLRLVPKFQLLDEQKHGVSLALLASVTVPTKTANAYFGDSGFGISPEVAVSRRLADLTLAGNLGYVARTQKQVTNLVVDDEVSLRAGAAYDLVNLLQTPLTLAATYSSATSAKNLYKKRNQNANEALFGATYAVAKNLDFSTAFGVGLSPGFGTPDFRVLLGVRMRTEKEPEPITPAPATEPQPAPTTEPMPIPQDRDQDGRLDNDDRCPDAAEDNDGFEDNDGCPDPDNDRDGVLDGNDACPMDPEDKDNFEDDDGCPDPDNDRDGVLDSNDACPADPEDKDNFEDGDGCPDPDNDRDNVPDYLDNCPNEPGDVSFQGCKAVQKVKLTGDKIEIVEKVYFDTGKTTIQSRSFALLDNVAKVLNEHPEFTHIRVEGHTDDVGANDTNKKLSQGRADSVRNYLIGKAVIAERLEAVGYGEERPLVPNKSSKNRAINRRVEFVIVGNE